MLITLPTPKLNYNALIGCLGNTILERISVFLYIINVFIFYFIVIEHKNDVMIFEII